MTTLDRGAVDALLARARRDVDEGLLPACQVALALDGEVLVHEAFGDADLDTRFTIFSATKPFIAAMIWQLLAEGSLRVDQPVHEVIPELAACCLQSGSGSGSNGETPNDSIGVSDGVRTRDNRNHNPALYQLSYGHRTASLG